MKYLLLSITLISSGMICAQSVEWESSFGGSESEAGNGIFVTDGGKYIIAGETASSDGDISGYNGGSQDAYIVQLNGDGSLLNQYVLGGSEYDFFTKIAGDVDGGYVSVGYTGSSDGDLSSLPVFQNVWVYKVDPLSPWQNALGGSGLDFGNDVIQTTDHDFMVVGRSTSNLSGYSGSIDFYVGKINQSNGTAQWQKCFGGTDIEIANGVTSTSDGGGVVVGKTNSTNNDVTTSLGAYDVWVIRVDDTGNLIWQKSLGGSDDDIAYQAATVSDGYIITGSTKSTDGDISSGLGGTDAFIAKTDLDGNLVWFKNYGGSGNDEFRDVEVDTDGNLFAVGHTYSNDNQVTDNHGSSDIWVIKTDSDGNLLDQRTIGGSLDDRGNDLTILDDNSVVITGSCSSSDGDATSNAGLKDLWVVKLDNTLEISTLTTPETQLSIYPSPTTDKTIIKTDHLVQVVEVFDTYGKLVHSVVNSKEINLSNLPDATYILNIKTDKGTFTQKIIKE